MAQNVNLDNPKYKMLKNILPETVTQVNFAVIDMDITMLSIADVLRNINRTFPLHTSARNAIANGQMAVAVLCQTEYLKPLNGLIIVICGNGEDVHIRSKEYIVMSVAEDTIQSNDKVLDMLDRFTNYLIKNYGEVIPSFDKFYTYFVYDAYELEGDN